MNEVRYKGSISDWCAIDFGYLYSNPLAYTYDFYLNGILIEGELILPDNITSIGNHTFYGFDALTSVTIGENVTTIGEYAFADCDNLTSVTIGENVTTIGDEAFKYCNNLTNVTIGKNVTTIGDEAFYSCDNLTSVTIGKNVTRIGSSAFEDCDNLTSVVFQDPYGWHVAGTPMSVTNATANAYDLSDDYCYYTWTKS